MEAIKAGIQFVFPDPKNYIAHTIAGDGLYSKQPFINALKENDMSYILYGHGNQYLLMNFFVLNRLAFFIHQILDLGDSPYQRCHL